MYKQMRKDSRSIPLADFRHICINNWCYIRYVTGLCKNPHITHLPNTTNFQNFGRIFDAKSSEFDNARLEILLILISKF